MSASSAVVLVYGIYMTGLDHVLLRHRLRAAGFDASIFSYPALRRTPARNAADLAERLQRLDHDVVHLVGHSLGGVTILHLFETLTPERAGRVVLLGAPVRGSGVARALAAHPLTRVLLGKSTVRGLLGDAPVWRGERELGTIAGDLGIGVGHVVGGIEGPSDGTVAVPETVVDNAADRLVLHVSHTGLLTSRTVANQTVHFLEKGRFAVETARPAVEVLP